MAQQTLKALEFPQLIRILQRFTRSIWGRRRLARLQPSSDFGEVQILLQEVEELSDLTAVEGPCPFEGCLDLTPILKRLVAPGSLLLSEELNQIVAVLRLISRVQRYLRGATDRHPHLNRYRQRLRDLSDLKKAIQVAISPYGLILDQASEELCRLRAEISTTRQQINRTLHQLFGRVEYREVLQDQVISQRNGRYVIPIKADFKGKVTGIIHDQSQSKATLFFEPFEIVNINNSLNLLFGEEKREEERILRHLTNLVRAQYEVIQEDLQILGEFDALQAKVAYAEEFKARTPTLIRQGRVRLKQARHPLLLYRDREEQGFHATIPIDLELTPSERFLVLSGANTGGKTVTLKTLGLLCVMVQCGIPLPVAEGSEVCIFDAIFADIGDTQNLAQNLSTFSAHMKRTADILAKLQGRCLVLLDELGTATDPAEGGALALALLRALGRTGAYGVATTHYHLLKAFAHEEPGFANVAVLFDDRTQKPLYRLAYGVAGPSNALSIARELGLPEEIIAEAERQIGQEGLQALQQLARCEAAQQHLVQREQLIRQEEENLRRQEEKLAVVREKLEQERRQLLDEGRQAMVKAIRQAENEFKDILTRLEDRQDSWGRLRQEFTTKQRQLHQRLVPKATAVDRQELSLALGQKVFLPALGQTGVVASSPDKEGRLEILVGAVKIRLSSDEIKEVRAGDELGRIYRGRWHGGVELPETAPWQSSSLNIIGLRVEEALPLVDRLLDQAVLHGCRQVDIIHGIGAGRLQQAVREHLRGHTLVKQLHHGEQGQAGRGVTVVEIKD